MENLTSFPENRNPLTAKELKELGQKDFVFQALSWNGGDFSDQDPDDPDPDDLSQSYQIYVHV